MTDKELLEYYNTGWDDESCGRTVIPIPDILAERAYFRGRLYYQIGDDVGSADLMTDEEIIKLIRDGVS